MKLSTACRGLLATTAVAMLAATIPTASAAESRIPDTQLQQAQTLTVNAASNIKHKYNLTMSPWEKDETIAFLTQCATQ